MSKKTTFSPSKEAKGANEGQSAKEAWLKKTGIEVSIVRDKLVTGSQHVTQEDQQVFHDAIFKPVYADNEDGDDEEEDDRVDEIIEQIQIMKEHQDAEALLKEQSKQERRVEYMKKSITDDTTTFDRAVKYWNKHCKHAHSKLQTRPKKAHENESEDELSEDGGEGLSQEGGQDSDGDEARQQEEEVEAEEENMTIAKFLNLSLKEDDLKDLTKKNQFLKPSMIQDDVTEVIEKLKELPSTQKYTLQHEEKDKSKGKDKHEEKNKRKAKEEKNIFDYVTICRLEDIVADQICRYNKKMASKDESVNERAFFVLTWLNTVHQDDAATYTPLSILKDVEVDYEATTENRQKIIQFLLVAVYVMILHHSSVAQVIGNMG